MEYLITYALTLNFLSPGETIMPNKKYDPRAIAETPKKLYTWESVTRTSSSFKIPKGRRASAESKATTVNPQVNYTYAKKTKEDNDRRREQNKRGRKWNRYGLRNKLYNANVTISDPRRRPSRDVEEPDHKLNSILHYLNCVTYEAIPCKEKNIQYYEKLADTIRQDIACLLYTSPSPRDRQKSRMPSSA